MTSDNWKKLKISHEVQTTLKKPVVDFKKQVNFQLHPIKSNVVPQPNPRSPTRVPIVTPIIKGQEINSYNYSNLDHDHSDVYNEFG